METWLILGYGSDRDQERNIKSYVSSIEWYGVTLEKSTSENIYLIDFNNVDELNSLPNDTFDKIMFDISTVKFTRWTMNHLSVINNKLKSGGTFYYPYETSMTVYNNDIIHPPLEINAIKYFDNYYCQRLSEGNYILNGWLYKPPYPNIAMRYMDFSEIKSLFEPMFDKYYYKLINYNLYILSLIFSNVELIYNSSDEYPLGNISRFFICKKGYITTNLELINRKRKELFNCSL